MSLSDLAIKKMYRTKQEDIVDLFLGPALRESCTYDRGSGYFTLSSLAELASGLVPFILHGGVMRVVTSVELNEDDIEILKSGASIQEHSILSNIRKKISESITDPDALLRLDVITNLIASGQISLRIAYMPEGIYHEKIGLLSDASGGKIYFSGSANATVSGLRKNWENIMVLTSWWHDEEVIDEQQNYFNNLWDNKVDGLHVMPFPEAEKRELLKKYKVSPDAKTAIRKFVGGTDNKYKRSPYDYQKIAIQQFINNGGNHFYEMATGTGKTYTAVRSIITLSEQMASLSAVILVPQIDLQSQWLVALNEEGIKAVPMGGEASSNETEYNFSSFVINMYSSEGLNIVVSTYDTFFGKYIKQIRSHSGNLLIVIDEAHNLSPNQIKQLPENFGYRLGLSATPERYSEDETNRIIQYFTRGRIETYKYSVEDAINAGYLSHYIYTPILVHLSESDFNSYRSYTKQLLYALNEEPRDQKKITDILTKRSSIVKKSNSKIDKLSQMISQQGTNSYDFRNAVVYCGHGKDYETDTSIIDSVTRLLAVEGHYTVSQFTSKTSERARVLKEFECGNYDVLVAIKCFDEGVDVPKLDKIYIMASDALMRQTIQRRGRVLRKCRETGKKIAYIYDFIALPPEGQYDGLGASNLVGNEMRRAFEYARLANNKDAIGEFLSSIMEMYGLQTEELEDEFYSES